MTSEIGAQDVEYAVLKLPEGARLWNLVYAFFELRKDVFVDQMHWDLNVAESIEFEQYDRLTAQYVVAYEPTTKQLLGGARLLRTDEMARSSGKVRYSYMIRDAYLGLLEGLPRDMCKTEPPTDPRVWELTRFVSFGNLHVGQGILRCVNEYLISQGARTCLFLGPPAFMRMARKMGFDPKPMGDIVGNKDGRFLAFACDVVPELIATPTLPSTVRPMLN